MQAKSRKAKPLTPLPPIGECARAAIADSFHKTIRHEKGTCADNDPEPLHQMRVGIRRLRATLQVFSPIVCIPSEGGMRRMGKIARLLGSARDLDVLQAELTSTYYPMLSEPEQQMLARIQEKLRKQRQKAFRDVIDLFASSLYEEFKETYQHWLENPDYEDVIHGQLTTAYYLPDLLSPLLSQLLQHAGWLVGAAVAEHLAVSEPSPIASLDANKYLLHDLRKHIKRVRYQLEFLSRYCGMRRIPHLKDLATAQDALGCLQDSQVLQERLSGILKADLSTVMPGFADILKERQTLAWKNWQQLQKKYLSLEYRQTLRSLASLPTTTLPITSL